MNHYMKTCHEYVLWRSKHGALLLVAPPIIKVVGTGIVLYYLDVSKASLSFMHKVSCSNNEAKYEALIIGMVSTLRMGTQKASGVGRFETHHPVSQRRVCIERDSSRLLPDYHSYSSSLSRASNSSMLLDRTTNMQMPWLAWLQGSIFLTKAIDVKVIKKTLRATLVHFISAKPIDEKDCQTSVIQNFLHPSSIVP